MKNPKVFILTLLCLFVLAACQQVEPVDPIDPVGDTFVSYFDLYEKAGVKAQAFTVDAELGGTFIGTQGITVIVPPNALRDQAGAVVQGEVTLNLKEFLSEKDMILSGLHTMSMNWGEILVSGGSFYLDAYQGTEALSISSADSITVEIPQVTQAEGFENAMMPFSGNVFQEGFNTLDWNLISEIPITQEQKNQVKLYSYSIRGFGFCNYDAFWQIPSDTRTDLKTTIKGASTGSSRIIVVPKDYTMAVNLSSTGIDVKSLGRASFPTGLEIKIIALNLDDDELKFGVLETISEENTIYEVEVKPGTVKELETLLDNPF